MHTGARKHVTVVVVLFAVGGLCWRSVSSAQEEKSIEQMMVEATTSADH